MTDPTEQALVEAAISGDRGAFAVLVRRYERLAVASAAAILGDRHAAQDVAQEAFVVAYQKLAMLRDGSAFGAWILRIARRRAIRINRTQRRTQPLDQDTAAGIADRNGQLDPAAQQLLQHVGRLPSHERMAVLLRYFDGHPVGVIADMTGQSVGTVTKQLTRARQRLRNWLKESDT